LAGLMLVAAAIITLAACGPMSSGTCHSREVAAFDTFLEKNLADFEATWDGAVSLLSSRHLFGDFTPGPQVAQRYMGGMLNWRNQLASYTATSDCIKSTRQVALQYEDNYIELSKTYAVSPSVLDSEQERLKINSLLTKVEKQHEWMRSQAR
jgi:hypothetical protein